VGEGTRTEHLEFPIEEISFDEVCRLFGPLYVRERLPIKEIQNVRWFASEVACGALVHASAKKARIKGTVTFPEWRGMGYGEQILLRLIAEAKLAEYKTIEIFAKYPQWFLDRGFHLVRNTPWGTSVLQSDLYGLTVTNQEANNGK
jgi:GNAT superfamily N-acetyltransferase